MVKVVGTKAEFDEILASAGDKSVVVDFYATWCGPCKVIAPYYEELSKQFSDVVFIKVGLCRREGAVSRGKSRVTRLRDGKPGFHTHYQFYSGPTDSTQLLHPFPSFHSKQIDVDENEDVAASAGISAMPTFQVYKNGKKVGELMGAAKDKLLALVEAHK